MAPDLVKAREWYEKAIAAGDQESSRALADLPWAPKRNAIREAGESGRYAEALTLQQDFAREIEADEVRIDGKPGERTAEALRDVSWGADFARDFPLALSTSERAHSLAPKSLSPEIKHAHALMFLDRIDEARALYLAHRDETIPEYYNKSWRRAIVDDFAEFRKAGLVRPLMDEIEAALAAKGS